MDCAFYTDDEVEINEDPIAAVQRNMDAKGLGDLKDACPTCFNNQRALWCAQTVPKYALRHFGMSFPGLGSLREEG